MSLDKLRDAIATVLTNASNFPDKVQSRLLGQDMAPLIDRVTEAVRAAAPEFDAMRRPCALPNNASPCVGCVCQARETWDTAAGQTVCKMCRWEQGSRI